MIQEIRNRLYGRNEASMYQYDVIIIGGGLGGLTAGALLAQRNKKVLLIEQHNIVGGCATTLQRKDLTVEVGLHEMDGMDPTDLKPALFHSLGLDRKIGLIRVPEFYRVIRGNDLDVTLPDRSDDAQNLLMDLYPSEKKGIRSYFHTIRSVREDIFRLAELPTWKIALMLPLFPVLFPGLIKSTGMTLGRFLDRHFRNEDLKLILSANLGYYHDDPYTMAMDYYGTAQGGYFEGGGHFIRGGSGRLSEALADIIRQGGGEIRTGRMADQILIQNGKAAGVFHTKKYGSDRVLDQAPVVLSNTAIPRNTEGLLKNTAVSEKISRFVKNKTISCSLLSVYMGFDGNVQRDGEGAYSTFILHPELKKLRDWAAFARGPMERRGFVFVDYGKIDSGLTPEGKTLGTICTTDYMSNWAPRKTEEYRMQKASVEKILMDRLEEHIPGVNAKLNYRETGTARTIERYTLNPEGSVYGFAQIPGQSGRHRHGARSPLPGLFYAGAWSLPGGGFTGAILSGLFAARQIDPGMGGLR